MNGFKHSLVLSARAEGGGARRFFVEADTVGVFGNGADEPAILFGERWQVRTEVLGAKGPGGGWPAVVLCLTRCCGLPGVFVWVGPVGWLWLAGLAGFFPPAKKSLFFASLQERSNCKGQNLCNLIFCANMINL